MKLVFLFGSAAVGKMTVGQSLMKQTGLRLFHNHMTIEPVIEILGYYDSKTITALREVIFRSFAKSDNKGMIFTFMWAFNMQEDWDYAAHVAEIFQKENAEIYYVELVADQQIRLQRNESPNRLANKASKRDIVDSNARLMNYSNRRFISRDGEIPIENFIRIDNSNLEADVVAKMIKEKFDL